MDYRRLINAQGLKQLSVPVADPSARMGVGDDESWQSYDMKLEYITKHTKVVIPDVNTPAYIAPMSRLGNLAPEDFPQAQYVGEAIGTWEGM